MLSTIPSDSNIILPSSTNTSGTAPSTTTLFGGSVGGFSTFEVYVAKETFKFNAAHFVAFESYRERLHGHNYQVGVRMLGQRQIGADGYLIDFGTIKTVTKDICKRLNEHFICPMYSNVLTIRTKEEEQQVDIECQDGTKFSFPLQDCAMLPIVHATTEELAIYLYGEILNGLHADYLLQRQIHTMEITVAEAPGQEATFRMEIPTSLLYANHSVSNTTPKCQMDVREYISTGQVVPMPCLTKDDTNTDRVVRLTTTTQQTGCNCNKLNLMSTQLERIAQAINCGKIISKGTDKTTATVTIQDLQDLLNEE